MLDRGDAPKWKPDKAMWQGASEKQKAKPSILLSHQVALIS